MAPIHKTEIRRVHDGQQRVRYLVVVVFTDGSEKILADVPSYIDACMFRVVV